MTLIEDGVLFSQNLIKWDKAGDCMNGFKVVQCENLIWFEPVVYDYDDPEIGYLNSSGPYLTWRGAFGAVGAVFDRKDDQVK